MRNTPTDDHIAETILTLLSEVHIRLTPRDLFKALREISPAITRSAMRKVIHFLVDDGQLIYTHHYSASQLELNFKRPVRVSNRVLLTPPDCQILHKPGHVIVKILDGSVFGGGDHPTTRMVLQGLDRVLEEALKQRPEQKIRVLDIGTGSGVLALAALKLGAASALGIDIDPLACDAAKKNAEINGLSHRLDISRQMPDEFHIEPFDLILANLRPPTLKKLIPKLTRLSTSGTSWVLSGFRVEEQFALEKSLPDTRKGHIWRSSISNWAVLAIRFPVKPVLTMGKR